jgi:hydroxypyruvate reductase
LTRTQQLHHLRQVFAAAIDSADAAAAVRRNLPPMPEGRCVVVGAGKAAAAMAAAVDSAWPDVDLSGVVATRYEHAIPAGRIRVLEAGHPVPDAASEDAARQVLEAVQGLSPDDFVIALISGGGSATMALPIEALTLHQKQDITRQLLGSGATISEINTVRVHLSRIKGGKLAAAAAPARLLTLIISDVPGDDPAAVASGPTIASSITPGEALDVLDRYRIDIPATVRDHLLSPRYDAGSPGAGEYKIVSSPSQALQAATDKAGELGYAVINLGDRIEADSTAFGMEMAELARSVRAGNGGEAKPVMIISGGETTVTLRKKGGRGGRNTEFLLSLAVALNGEAGVYALAADTDGIDGTSDAAGAVITPDTLERASAAGIDPNEYLSGHDSYNFFRELGDLIVTGPTLTNVNDIRLVAVV